MLMSTVDLEGFAHSHFDTGTKQRSKICGRGIWEVAEQCLQVVARDPPLCTTIRSVARDSYRQTCCAVLHMKTVLDEPA
jgi:hypothetical protein